MEIIKYQGNEVLPHIRHNLREIPNEKSSSNGAINPTLTKDNYNLVDRGKTATEVNQYRKTLEKEIFHYNRKNLVHAIEVVLQCPEDCPQEQHQAFFQESYRYICSTLPMGEKCVFSAVVHRDERHHAPDGTMISKDHLHLMYIPAVPDKKHAGFDYKLCADQLTKRATLKALHPGLQKHLDQAGIQATVYRKKSGDGKAIHLSVSQLKEITAKTGIVLKNGVTVDTLSQILNTIQAQKKEIHTLQHTRRELEAKIQQQAQVLQKKEAELNDLREKEQKAIAHGQEKEAKPWGYSENWGQPQIWGNNTIHNEINYEKEEIK